MTRYSDLKKIIPPDQALANEALSRTLRQVKGIFNADLPSLSQVVQNLESNKGLPLINALQKPVPDSVQNFWGNVFATGTGPGNTITVNDMLGVASGNTTSQALSEITSVVGNLESSGALEPLVANVGNAFSPDNGVYTVMKFCLQGTYTTSTVIDPGPPPVETYTVTVPTTVYFTGGSYSGSTPGEAISQAFAGTLIPAGNSWIANIANANPNATSVSNQNSIAIASQLGTNVKNCTLAGIDMPTLVNDIANTDFESNSISTVLSMTLSLHDYGLDISEGGAAQFFDAVANQQNIYGQAVVSSMREGRNIALLNAVGIQLDTQLSSTNPNPRIANNISNGQYTVAEATANLKY